MTDSLVVRAATVQDVPLIAELINSHAQNGLMLQRPISRIYDNLRDYTVLEHNGELVGCGALHVTWADLAEIRSLAIKQGYQRRGYGRLLVEHLIVDARVLLVEKVFALTYQQKFFSKMGFAEIDKGELPHKIWSECVNCIHFPNCNEIAVIRTIAPNGEESGT